MSAKNIFNHPVPLRKIQEETVSISRRALPDLHYSSSPHPYREPDPVLLGLSLFRRTEGMASLNSGIPDNTCADGFKLLCALGYSLFCNGKHDYTGCFKKSFTNF
jgi:hypothetical protein